MQNLVRNLMKIKKPKLGRQVKGVIDRFQTMAWFNSIANVLGDSSPTHLEQIIQPENVKKDEIGKLKTSRSWDKYKIGARLPTDGYLKDGKPGAVLAAEKIVAESAYVYRHPIWAVMRTPVMSYDVVTQTISTLRPSVARYYMDLSETMKDTRAASLAQNIGLRIWIERNDYHASLDHLA